MSRESNTDFFLPYSRDFILGYGDGFLTKESAYPNGEEYMAGYKMGMDAFMFHQQHMHASFSHGFLKGRHDANVTGIPSYKTGDPYFDSGYAYGFFSVEPKHVTHDELVSQIEKSQNKELQDIFNGFLGDDKHTPKKSKRSKHGSGGKSKRRKSKTKSKSKKNNRR
jgi:hypothetical protein